MLTRLKVSGFKNLVEVDVRFGPFTCVAGANAVGKSNLFDAIGFLGALATMPLAEAAKSVRDSRTPDARSLFHRVGDSQDPRMTFECEMIIPQHGLDDLGQEIEAAVTLLRYSLTLGLKPTAGRIGAGGLQIESENLDYIKLSDARDHLLFRHGKNWRDSVLRGRKTTPFLSTETAGGVAKIKLHQDRGESGGRPALFPAATLPRTVLSVASGGENRTAVLVRREMQSWRRLQLESSALRKPDDFNTSPRMGADGACLAATLYSLARGGAGPYDHDAEEKADVYAKVANRLAELIDDVRDVRIDVDPQRELLTLMAADRAGTEHPAQALSDGTLRFLALAVIELDPSAQGLLCLEEPENGIHPTRIPAMLRLLQDIAVDPHEPVGPDNPLRQIIINTHSPVVVSEVPDDSLLVALPRETIRDGRRFRRVSFAGLTGTWRDQSRQGETVETVPRGVLLDFLRPIAAPPVSNGHATKRPNGARDDQRVIDRPEIRQLLLPWKDEGQ